MSIPKRVCEEYDKSTQGLDALQNPKLKEADAILKLSKALGSKFLHFFVYGAVEGEVLVLYLSHPAMVSEFAGQKARVLEEMRAIYKKEHLKGVVTFKDIRATLKARPAPKEETKEAYRDRATGEFTIYAQVPELRKVFERIQKTIKEGHENGE